MPYCTRNVSTRAELQHSRQVGNGFPAAACICLHVGPISPPSFILPVVRQQDFDLLHARPDELVDCDFAVSVLVHLLERRLGEEILKNGQKERVMSLSFIHVG